MNDAQRSPTRSMRKTVSSNQAEGAGSAIAKKKRGRQPRPSLLSTNLQQAISGFTTAVGSPVYQPGGFRDITGWLESIADQSYQGAWTTLAGCFLQESANVEERRLLQVKKDVVTEIMTNVVKRLPHECNKLVSTNARRQCKQPPSGHTVMTLFESHIQRVAGTTKSLDRRGSSSRSSSGIEISSLLVENPGGSRNADGAGSSTVLPPVSHLDEGIRQFKAREDHRRIR